MLEDYSLFQNGGGDNPIPGQYLKSINNTVIGTSYVGGVAGYLYDSNNLESHNTTVKGSGSNIGGCIGYGNNSNNTVVNCSVEGTSSTSNNVGGIAGGDEWGGTNNRVIDTIVMSKGSNVGGIFGSYKFNGSISNNYVLGGSVTGYSKAGGIIGYADKGVINKSYTNTRVTAISNSAGGIAGYVHNVVMDSYSVGIRNCYVANATIEAPNYAGGLIGSLETTLQGGETYFYNNYIQADVIGNNMNTTSLGIGKQKSEINLMNNIYVYQYSTINKENLNLENDPYIGISQYLKEADLKQETTYKTKLGWGTNYLYTTLPNGKYPIINGLANQEGIDLPKDSEHMLDSEHSISLMSMEEELPLEAFEYEGKEIEVYENYSMISSSDGKEVRREERLYTKDGKLYVIDGSLPMVPNNLIIDSYNGKEYETILGTDGKIYDLKEKIHYPENFKNTNIVEMTNNLHTDYKITTVSYADGSRVQFNYQTGEILNETKTENDTSIIEYLKEQMETGSNLIENATESYEENKNLISKLQTTPIEKAIELKEASSQNTSNIENSDNKIGAIENNNNQGNSITPTDRESYITVYNSSKKEFEVYKVEEILNAEEMEVISENEKIEKNNLSEYYTRETIERKNLSGMIWIVLSITGVVVILGILWQRKNV